MGQLISYVLNIQILFANDIPYSDYWLKLHKIKLTNWKKLYIKIWWIIPGFERVLSISADQLIVHSSKLPFIYGVIANYVIFGVLIC